MCSSDLTGEDWIEPGPQLDQRADFPADSDFAEVRSDQAIDDFQHRAFAGAIGADQAEALAAGQIETGVPYRVKLPGAERLAGLGKIPSANQLSSHVAHPVPHRPLQLATVLFPNIANFEDVLVGHESFSGGN